MYRKAIGNAVAYGLILMMIVISTFTFSRWYFDYNSGLESGIDYESTDSLNPSSIKAIIGGINIYYRNTLGRAITIDSVKMNGEDCGISGTYPAGLNIIRIQENCTTMGVNNIVMVTNEGIIEEKLIIEDAFILIPKFRSVWNTTLGTGNNVTLPLTGEVGSDYNFTVDWGDGSSDLITAYDQDEVTHNYTSEGTYIVKIKGTIKGFSFANGGDKDKITDISEWGPLNLGNNEGYFYGCSNLDISATDELNLSGTTTFRNMFRGASSLTTPDLSQWNVSSVTSMSYMFGYANNFNSDLSNWDTSSVTLMREMFLEADSFNQDLNEWDVSNVQTMHRMFYWNNGFNGSLANWNVSKVTTMFEMFILASSFNGNISNWTTTNELLNTDSMFKDAISFNGNISNWDVSGVTNMNSMFMNAGSFNQNLSSWNVSKVTSCNNFNLSTPVWTLPQPIFTSC